MLALVGGLLVWRLVFSVSAQPAEALPANAMAYVAVDLDPSGSQKIAAYRFLDRFPAFDDVKDETGIDSEDDDIRQRLVETAAGDGADVDWESDIEPWLRQRAGLAVVPDVNGDDSPDVVFAIETSDADAAVSSINDLGERNDTSLGVVGAGDWVLVAETQDIADDIAASVEDDGSLSDADNFAADMDELGNPGVMSGWVDLEALAELSSEALGAVDMGDVDFTQFNDFATSAAFAVRFDDRYLEIATITSGGSFEQPDASDNGIEDLPDDTFFAASMSGGTDLVNQFWDDIEELIDASGGSGDLAEFQDVTGLSLPDDLATLLGESFSVAVGPDSDFGAAEQDPAAVDFGVVAQTDVDALRDLIERVQDAASADGVDLPISIEDDGDVLVAASNQSYADALLDGGDLGGTDAFSQAVPNAGEATQVVYFNVDQVDGEAVDMLAEFLGPQIVENIEPLQAIGYSTHISDDGQLTSTLRVVAND